MKESGQLKCRQCKVSAERTIVNGIFVSIHCPNCCVCVEGKRASELHRQELQHLTSSFSDHIIQNDLGIELDPGQGPEIPKPDWEFFVDFDD